MKKEEAKFKYNRNKIPRNPGCYLFFDEKDALLYVGKAKNLQSRVSSYFQKTKKPLKTHRMVQKIAKIETRIVNSEMEALILENNLVKEFMPKFNVLLRDDKNFLYLRVTKEDFPRLEITRRIVRDGSFYVGPKTSAKKFRKTINFCQKVFQIRTCRVGIESVNSPLLAGGGEGAVVSKNIHENWYESKEKIIENAKKLRKNQTKMEEMMWGILRNKNFFNLKFRRQHPVGNYVLDFYCPEKKIAIEIDGIQHKKEKNKKYDEERTFFLNKQEIRVIRFSNDDVFNNLEGVLNDLYSKIFTTSPQPSPARRGSLQKVVEITANPERKKLPCMDYHIKKCSGPCDGLISREKYEEQVKLMKKFLRGDTREVLKGLQAKMMELAAEKKFEAAGKMRDLIKSIESSTEKQRVQFDDQISRDFLSFYREKRHVYLVRLQFRQGRFIDQNEVRFSAEKFLEDSEVWEKVLLQFYEKVDEIPAKIFVPVEPENKEQIEELLKVAIIAPQKGDKKKVLEMAAKSAHNFAKKAAIESMAQEEIFAQALPRLAEKLGLKNPPRRMECYDISHLSGTHTVASQVVFIDGRPKSSEYRRFKIKTLKSGEIDDFAAIKEVLERRFKGYEKESAKSREIFEIRKIEDKKNKTKLLKFGNKIFNNELNFPSEIIERHFDENQYSHWGAFDKKGNIVGMIKVKKFIKSIWQITGLAVDKKFRGKNIGTKLVEKLSEYARENSVKNLFVLPDKTSEEFYTGFGFAINKSPLKSIQKYLKKMEKEYAETNTIFESYEWAIPKPKTEIPRNPDLIVIDGGKGQLSAVLNALKDMPNIPIDIETQVVALAKREEEVFRGKFTNASVKLPSSNLAQAKNLSKFELKAAEIVFEELSFDINSAESKLLQRIRDEAHRFAISFNRNLREKSAKKSMLDEIRGIGPKTKKELLQKFNSPSGIRSASDDELLEILNTKQLENLRKNL